MLAEALIDGEIGSSDLGSFVLINNDVSALKYDRNVLYGALASTYLTLKRFVGLFSTTHFRKKMRTYTVTMNRRACCKNNLSRLHDAGCWWAIDNLSSFIAKPSSLNMFLQ